MRSEFTGAAPYADIQHYIEENLHLELGVNQEDVKNVCIVGAYYGSEIVTIRRKYTNAHVYAFEAYKQHFDVLHNNYKDDNMIHVFNDVVSDYNGLTCFYELSLSGCGSILKYCGDNYEESHKIISVTRLPCVKLSNRLGSMIIDLLWVDVQGAEMKVLRGCDIKNVKSLFLEVLVDGYKAPYEGQCFLSDLKNYLKDTHVLISTGINDRDGQGNSFWVRKDLHG